MDWIETITANSQDFERFTLDPVLIACIRRGFGFDEQIRIVEGTLKQFHPWVRFLLMDEDHIRYIGSKYAISGDPFFLFFQDGKLKARLLGSVDATALGSFLAENVAIPAGYGAVKE